MSVVTKHGEPRRDTLDALGAEDRRKSETAMSTTRRELLLALSAGGTALGVGWCGLEPLHAVETAALQAARRQAAHRRRRIIFNNDGDDIWSADAVSQDGFLNIRHKPLLETQVDSIFYCTTQSFNLFTHDTRVSEVFTSQDAKFKNNQLSRFLQQGTDGLRMSSQFARRHDLESFWTLRMNDIHDAWTPAFQSKWKSADSKRVMGRLEESKNYDDRRRLWSLVDFEHPDVEPRLLAIIEEVLENYSLDGIELDFLRAPIYFRTAFEGKPVTQQQVGILTRLLRGIRSIVLKQSERQGKPLLLAVRVPTSTPLCRKIGIDIRVWLKEELIDLMSLGGGYITFDANVKELVDLAHHHQTPAYPCLSQSGLMHRPPRGNSTRQSEEAWFGAAAHLWNKGADGIYSFNLFPNGETDDTTYARKVLGAIGSTQTLADQSAVHAISDAGWWMPAHYWAKDAAEYGTALPMALEADTFERTSLFVPEDLRGAGFNVTAELRIDFTGLKKSDAPHILFGSANFGPQENGKIVGDVRRFTCSVPLSAIRQGPNRVMVKTRTRGVKLAGVELWIKR